MIIDAGNANFHDTRRRAADAEAAGVPFLGIGVSGGEEGARHGPSIMGGGPKAAWDRVAPILEAIAAKFDGEPCATWMGTDGAGHFVKTVHNGIEYADMQMIAEIYGIMRDGLGLKPDAIAKIFDRWNEGPLKSYLIEITGKVCAAIDPETGKPMVEVILDRAGQKGTGRWTAIEAQMLGAPATAIEAAVAARNLSARLDERRAGRGDLPDPRPRASAAAPRRTRSSRRRCSPARSPAMPRASASSPPPRRSSAGTCRSRRSPRSGGRAASSARRCSTTWHRRSRRAATNLMFAPAFAERLRATHGSLAPSSPRGRCRDPDAGARRGARLFRHDAPGPRHREPPPGPARLLRRPRLRARRQARHGFHGPWGGHAPR